MDTKHVTILKAIKFHILNGYIARPIYSISIKYLYFLKIHKNQSGQEWPPAINIHLSEL
jgi:hypothetical protein